MNAKIQPDQMSLDIAVPLADEMAIQILRNEYLRNNGDLTEFFAEIARDRPETSDPSDSWTLPGRLLQKSL